MRRLLIFLSLLFLAASCADNNGTANEPQSAGSGPSQPYGFVEPRTPLPEIDPDSLPIEEGILTYAPDVPPPITRSEPALVKYALETTEEVGRLADGVEYQFWTFSGSVPGPMLRVREGDMVELTLTNNSTSAMPHNIDLHAVTGPGGGADLTYVVPGESRAFRFRALNPGVYIYHCAVPPVGMHVANGMYGLIVVDPVNGWTEVDREYYVLQSEFYTEGDFGAPGLQRFSLRRALAEDPAYVVFNGGVDSLRNENALHAEVGERVRMFFGNAGPNLASSFHIIGVIFDLVYLEGGSHANRNVDVTLVPAGGAVIAEMEFHVPGDYLLVDHSIFRAFNKGALGTITVQGPENPVVYLETPVPGEAYLPSPGPTSAEPEIPDDELSPRQRIAQGDVAYRQNCASCHGESGQGVPNLFPPLSDSPIAADADQAITSVLTGREGDWGIMPAFSHLSDADIARILTFVRQAFGNNLPPIQEAEVTAIRNEL